MGVIGIIPAAGKAERMGGLPKFALPTPDGCLIGRMCYQMIQGGVGRLLVGTTHDNGGLVEANVPETLATVYRVQSATMSETVLAAARWTNEDDLIALAMPDTFFTSKYGNVFELLRERLAVHPDEMAAVAAWKIRPEQRGKLGLLDLAEDGQVLAVIDKQRDSELDEIWGAVMWRAAFWPFIQAEQPHVGYALADAVQAGERVGAVRIEGRYFDCGTRDEYYRLCARFLDRSVS